MWHKSKNPGSFWKIPCIIQYISKRSFATAMDPIMQEYLRLVFKMIYSPLYVQVKKSSFWKLFEVKDTILIHLMKNLELPLGCSYTSTIWKIRLNSVDNFIIFWMMYNRVRRTHSRTETSEVKWSNLCKNR